MTRKPTLFKITWDTPGVDCPKCGGDSTIVCHDRPFKPGESVEAWCQSCSEEFTLLRSKEYDLILEPSQT